AAGRPSAGRAGPLDRPGRVAVDRAKLRRPSGAPRHERSRARSRSMVLKPTRAGLLRAAQLVRSGAVVAFPTDTVTGLGPSADEAGTLSGVMAVIDGGAAPGGTASTVVDLTGPEPHVLREGAIPAPELLGPPAPRSG